MRGALRVVLDFALAQLCPCCREPVSEGKGLCAPCWSKLSLIEPPYRIRLEFHLPMTRGPGLLSMEAIADPPAYKPGSCRPPYDDVASTLVHGLKYSDRLDLSPMMGRWMARAGHELLADADALVPVPLHWRWTRRYSQSVVLARAISAICGVPIAHGGPKRIRATTQHGRAVSNRVRR
jgi:predicted amidophosphoribosyltransferase